MSFRAGLQQGLKETVTLCQELTSTHVVLGKLFEVYCIEFWRNWIENTKVSVARNMSRSIYSDGHFSTTIGRLPCWSALGSFRLSVRLSHVTPCSPQLLQFVQNSSSMWWWRRTCMVVVACIAVKCDHVLCPVQFLFLQKITDFEEQCICIKLLFQMGKIGAETFQ